MSGSLSAHVKELVRGGSPLGRRVYRAGIEGDIGLGTTNLFTVNGGDILLVAMYAEVSINIGALVGVTTCRVRHTPTGGVATNMCGDIADIAGAVVGTLYCWNGAIAGALTVSASGVDAPLGAPQVLVPGIISHIIGTNAQTGAMDWILHYIPLDTDSKVVAA